MSQQHGVSSSLASIEAAPPNGTETTSATSHLHPSTSSNSSVAPQSSNSRRSGTISGRVHIPKLSATTKELLARFAGNIKGTQQQQVLPRDDITPVSFAYSSNWNIQNTDPRRAGKMRASSTFIELPTAPFVYPTRVETSGDISSPVLGAPPSTNGGITETPPKSFGLANIAPKPTVAHAALAPALAGSQIPVHTPLPSEFLPPSSNGTNGTSEKSHGSVTITAKPTLAYSSSIPAPAGPQVQAHAQLPSEHQPQLTNGTHGATAKSIGPVNIAPKPAVTYSTSPPVSTGPQVPANIQLQPENPPPPPSLPPLAPAPTIINSSNTSLPKPSTAIPVKPTSSTRQRRGTGNRKSGSKKRKRGHDSDGEDIIRAVDSSSDESDIAPAATQTKSGRQVNRPSLYVPSPLSPAIPKEGNGPLGGSDKHQETTRSRKRVPRKGKNTNITCTYCQRGHSPPSNAIVFCDGCNRPWHQHCHDPPIGTEVTTVKEKEWLCCDCKPVNITILHPTVVRSNPSRVSGPLVHPPLVMPRTDVGGEHFSTDDRRRFLSTLSHAALVELLLTVSNKHPTVPMFPENMRSLPSSNFASSSQAIDAAITAPPTPLPSVSTDNPVPSNSVYPQPTVGEEKSDLPNTAPASERTRKRHYYESSDDESEYEFQEHRLYPRAGNGIRLSTNEEDLDILQEDPACSTFSYALHKPPSVIVGNDPA
ncbi:hypothetical protein BDW62DRAFT_179380 [Aspergillus aurantiobrunneus]